MCKTKFAVRPCTNAQVIAKLPIVQVVPAFVARLRIGRNFVPLQTLGARHCRDQVHHFVGIVLLWQNRGMFCKQGIGFDGEVIDGNVRRLEAQGRFDVL